MRRKLLGIVLGHFGRCCHQYAAVIELPYRPGKFEKCVHENQHQQQHLDFEQPRRRLYRKRLPSLKAEFTRVGVEAMPDLEALRIGGRTVRICGQGPSDHPDLAQWLVEEGIESLSLNPDTVVETSLYLARAAKAGA